MVIFATHNLKFIFPFYAVLGNFFLSQFVYWQNRHSRINVAYALTALVAVFWTIAVFFYSEARSAQAALFWSRSASAISSYIPVLFLYFFSVFPRDDDPPRPWQVAAWFTTATFFALISFTHLVVKDVTVVGKTFYYLPGPVLLLYFVYFVSFIGYAFFRLFQKYRLYRGINRLQISYVFLGFFLSSFFPVLTNLILPLLGYSQFAAIGPSFTVIAIASIAFAITKARLMDISVIISRFVAEFLAILSHGVVYVGLVVLYRASVSPRIDPLFIAWTVCYGILVGQTHHSLRLFFQTTADKLFLHGRYNYYRSLSNASSQVGAKLALPDILKVLYDTFQNVVEISDPRVFLPEYFSQTERSSERYLVYRADRNLPEENGQSVEFNSPLVQTLVATRAPVTDEKNLKAALVVPCLLEDRLIGFFALGAKLSEDPFTDEDLRLIQVLANQAAITLDHTRSYQRIKEDLEAAERQLERSQRLASLGTLTAGVTHEIRNPLTVIRGETERLANETRDLAYLQQFRDLLLKHIDRISGIVERMLGLAKEKPKKDELVDLNEQINATLQLCPVSQLTVKTDLGSIRRVKGDPVALQEVFVNLIQNASEAMPGGGTLTLRTFNEDHRVVVEVSDTGKGIPDEIREKIFDPFYSTRHEGVGLGLSIVYRIVREHGGDIKVASTVGKGSTFRLSFSAS